MKRIYVDMDDTICNFFGAAYLALKKEPGVKYPQSQYGFFTSLQEIPGAIDGMRKLAKTYSVWILTRPSVLNPLCYTEKRVWVEEHLGLDWCHKLILCPDKSLLKGDYLIDDCIWKDFEGEQIVYGSEAFPDWKAVMKYFVGV